MAETNSSLVDEELPPPYEASLEPIGPRFCAEHFANDGKKHVLIAGSGSLGMVKFSLIVGGFRTRSDVSIRIVLTKAAMAYFPGPGTNTLADLAQFPHVEGVYTDDDEWAKPVEEIVLEHELSRWLDILLIAPADSNTLGKMANGIADNLLTSIVAGFDHHGTMNPPGRENRQKHLIAAAALNQPMRDNPATKRNINSLLRDWRVQRRVPPIPPARESKRIVTEAWCHVIMPTTKDERSACRIWEGGNGMVMYWTTAVNHIWWQITTYDDPLYPQKDGREAP